MQNKRLRRRSFSRPSAVVFIVLIETPLRCRRFFSLLFFLSLLFHSRLHGLDNTADAYRRYTGSIIPRLLRFTSILSVVTSSKGNKGKRVAEISTHYVSPLFDVAASFSHVPGQSIIKRECTYTFFRKVCSEYFSGETSIGNVIVVLL